MNQNAKIDDNRKRTLLAITDDANAELRRLLVDNTTGRLLVSATITGGAITSINGLTAAVQLFATGTTGTDFAIVSGTATHTFNIPDASATARGLITTGNQTLAGIKTFSSFPITPSSAPTTDYQTANKKYVDDSISVENLFDRTGTILSPHTAGDSIRDVADYNGLVVGANTGVITTGTWHASVVTPLYGGTGITNNVLSTLTITGSFATTFTISNTTSLTLPTSGTLATLAGAETFTNKVSYNGLVITANTGAITSGSWAGTAIPITYGGTGQASKATAFDALSPMSQAGDIIYGGASGTGTRLAIGGANTVLHGGASVPAYSAVVEADITLAANTTNNVSTTKHGFAPTLSNLTTQFLRGDGAWAIPGGTTVPNAYTSETFTYVANTAHNIVHNFGTFPVVQAFDTSGNMVVPYIVQHTDSNTTAITFTVGADYTLILTIGSPPLTAFTTTSGNYNMLAGDYLIEETGSGKIVTLLTPVGRSGKQVIIKNSSAGICDVQTAAGTIDGIADVTLASGDSLSVCSNNTIWLVI